MATEKTKRSLAAGIHAVTYTLPFLFLTTQALALAVICVTHFVIDRWRLARYVCWAKNWIGIPPLFVPGTRWWAVVNRPWKECSTTGYAPDRPPWLTVWLLIITDNIMHILINGMAFRWLT